MDVLAGGPVLCACRAGVRHRLPRSDGFCDGGTGNHNERRLTIVRAAALRRPRLHGAFLKKRFAFWIGLSAGFSLPAAAQKNAHAEPQVHNTVTLPAAAHKKGQTAGFFVDPITGYKVYRLSDGNLCPSGATHFYSYSNQFSPQGRMVFDC